MEEEQGGGDQRWVFDDDFVRQAPIQEPTADERIARLVRIDAGHRALDQERRVGHRQARRTERRRRRRSRVGVLALFALVAAVGWSSWDRRTAPGSEAAGFGADVLVVGDDVTRFPPPAEDQEDEPLGRPLPAPADGGTHAFIQRQDDGSPVAYDPCRPIHVVVQDRTRPDGAGGLVAEALDEVGRITGLEFVLEGPTDEVLTDDRAPVQDDRYGNRWAPVLVAWSDPEEASDLAGEVAGYAGSQSISRGDGPATYVTGTVVLDGPDLAEILARPSGRAEALAVVLHEVGHLVGLDHVDDASELLAPESNPGVVQFGPGDRTGLAALGAGPCAPDL